MTDERQKKTTDQYRANWDEIFKKQITKVIENDNRHHPDECCNHDCNQGRDCPNRKGVVND
jgi:hypothetical protein